jgi:formamidopyrimidine-DNA glycosylase
VKNFIMDSKVVVGVGNIYANEALFAAGIRPGKAAGRITLSQYQLLVKQIKAVLNKSIQVGGTSLRDFTGGDGQPGYFRQALKVYGRNGESCRVCDTEIRLARTGQRGTFYCPQCQR